MKIIKPGFEFITPINGSVILKRLEECGRVCYKEYVLKNDATGHFHCRRKSDDALVQFWAGTGKILGYTQRGIHNLIRICEEE